MVCQYCGQKWHEDARGGCSACGAPGYKSEPIQRYSNNAVCTTEMIEDSIIGWNLSGRTWCVGDVITAADMNALAELVWQP